jgi:hypothetical protein
VSSGERVYFSWCFIKMYETQLCTNGWRVPTAADACKITGGGSFPCSQQNLKWDGLYGYATWGCIANQTVMYSGTVGDWATNTNYDGKQAYIMKVWSDTHNSLNANGLDFKHIGWNLRCVK